jgi:hypothetical protein
VLKTLEQLRGAMTIDATSALANKALPRTPTQPIALTQEPKPPSTAQALSALRPSPLPYVIVGGLVVAALALTGYALTRPAPQSIVAPLPPPVERPVLAVVDAGPKQEPVADAGLAAAAATVEAAVDAGAKAPVAVRLSRGITAAALKAHVAALERKLEQREASRGEAVPVLRALLKQAREDASKANTDAERREVWQMLDEVARQIDR